MPILGNTCPAEDCPVAQMATRMAVPTVGVGWVDACETQCRVVRREMYCGC